MNYNEKTIDELKAEVKSIQVILKGKRDEQKLIDAAELKATRLATGNAVKDTIHVGDVVTATYKGDTVNAEITRINEETVSVRLTDTEGNKVLNKEGKQVNTWKYFWQVTLQ